VELDLNEAGLFTATQGEIETERNNFLNALIPTPGKKMSTKKCRKRQKTRHPVFGITFYTGTG
jgi:hypothetical protein